MHIPDGLMDPVVLIIGWLLALPVIAYAIVKVDKTIDEKKVPFMAILAAGIFIAQMLNFPVGGGTTGHLIGATLAVILLGVYGSVVIMTVILTIQCLVFGDGGITALGLNLLNMAVIAPFAAAAVLLLFKGRAKNASTFSAAWLAVFMAATACALQLSMSFDLSNGEYGIEGIIAIPTMLAWHALIGVGEGIITTGIVAFLAKVSPETLKMQLGRPDDMEPMAAEVTV
jgi:cobalt/nickel transport system permease protein